MRGSATPNGTPSQTAQVGAYSCQMLLSSTPNESEVASAKRRKQDSDALRSALSAEPTPPTHGLVVRTVQLFASRGGGVERSARMRPSIAIGKDWTSDLCGREQDETRCLFVTGLAERR